MGGPAAAIPMQALAYPKVADFGHWHFQGLEFHRQRYQRGKKYVAVLTILLMLLFSCNETFRRIFADTVKQSCSKITKDRADILSPPLPQVDPYHALLAHDQLHPFHRKFLPAIKLPERLPK